jgi:hypothetical protein
MDINKLEKLEYLGTNEVGNKFYKDLFLTDYLLEKSDKYKDCMVSRIYDKDSKHLGNVIMNDKEYVAELPDSIEAACCTIDILTCSIK